MNDRFSPDFAGMGQPGPVWNAKRPLRIAVLGDFGAGAARGRLDTGTELARRKPLKVEFDTVDDAMRRLQLALVLPVGRDGAPVTIGLADLDAFHPDTIHAGVSLFDELGSLRKRLNHPRQFAAAAAQVLSWAEDAGPKASSLTRRAVPRGGSPSRRATLDDFARLTGRASAAASGEAAIDGLLQRVVGPFVHPASSPDKDKLVAAVDAGLSDAMQALLHHPDFQNSESLWRGVDFLLRRVETGPELQVHLLDISAEEFAADLSSVPDLCESGLYKLLVQTPSQEAGGGYTYIAGCYQFDATPPHAELLGRAAQIASHAGASLLTGINTDPFADRKEPPHRLVSEAFAALRALPAASFLGLFGPRFLLRHPYGKKSDPISAFAFEEFNRESGLRAMLWGHPALLALTVLAQHGAPSTLHDLPFHHYVDEHGDAVALPCTDRLISADTAALLRDAGINALMAHKGEAMVRFSGVEAVNGDGLRVAGAHPRKAPADSRFAVQSRIDANVGQVGAGVTTAARERRPPQAVASEHRNEPREVSGEADDDGHDATTPSLMQESAPDGELADLLASFDDPSTSADDVPASEEPADGKGVDPDLDALLKSLG